MKKVKLWLKFFFAYITITGLVVFSLFILEESFQTVMFGTWPAQDAKRWDIVCEGTELMDDVIWTMNAVNYTVGYIQPIAFISYRSYAKSAKFYTKALRAKAFAHAPEEFVGKEVTFKFQHKEIRSLPDGSFLLVNGKIGVRVWERPKSPQMDVSGVLKNDFKLFVVELKPKEGG